MSNAQQHGGQPRQQYPSPTSFPSPSLTQNINTSAYYPPPNNTQSEYRASPTGSNSSLSLPSMRTLDPVANMNALPNPNHQGAPPYYGQLPHPQQTLQQYNITSDPNGQNVRYQLPQHEQSRVMSGGRHKKEIKRRTKTGCLTCRKRRIKCDEAHPACRNCQKSKRECMGYDPIFKQQPGTAAIQPAPSSAPTSSGSAATANPYGQQQHMVGGYPMPPVTMGYENNSVSAGVGSPSSSTHQPYETFIDPALEAVGPAGSGGYQTSSAKRTVQQLLNLGGPPPTPSAQDLAEIENKIEETKHLYYSIYAPGLENFLESKWYSTKGLQKLLGNKDLLDQFAVLLYQFSKTGAGDTREMVLASSVEARIVWSLAHMVRATAAEPNGNKESRPVPSIEDPYEAANRLGVFEALLTGRVATVNPLTTPVPGSTDHHRLRELEFWHTMGDFVCLREDDPNLVKNTDDILANLRNLLDGRENRDVLYSIAVVRAIGPRVQEYTDDNTPLHLDESDNKSKLLVAKKFVQDEANGAGTTNVIRRLCELSARSWSMPNPGPASMPAGIAMAGK